MSRRHTEEDLADYLAPTGGEEAAPAPKEKRRPRRRAGARLPSAPDPTDTRRLCVAMFPNLRLDTLPQPWFDLIFGATDRDDVFTVLDGIEKHLRRDVGTLCPEPERIWRWARLDPADVRVVILGYEPYHVAGAADGLAYSVSGAYAAALPGALINILAAARPAREDTAKGDLSSWCDQGVLLLNMTLTTVRGAPNAHEHVGWQLVTDNVIKRLGSKRRRGGGAKIFMLWGERARKKKELIDATSHAVLESCHPARADCWFARDPFGDANVYLTAMGSEPIVW